MTGSGNALRSAFPLGVRGISSIFSKAIGDHVVGKVFFQMIASDPQLHVGFADHVSDDEDDVFRVLLDQGYAIGDSPGYSRIVFSISPSSIRSPRILTW